MIRGNLDLLILSLLEREQAYGLQLAKEINTHLPTGEALSFGSLYPALHKLEKAELIVGETLPSSTGGRPTKYYRLTESGRTHLTTLKAQHEQLQRALGLIWTQT